MGDANSGIRLERHESKGRYVLPMPGGEAELTFIERAPDHILIDYSFVPPQHRGTGVALKLVMRAVEDARQAGVSITPLCGYVAAEFRRHPEWADVLKQ